MNNEIVVDGKTYVLKDEEKTYKIGDKFRVKDDTDVVMLTEYGTDEINFVKLKRQSCFGVGVGETCFADGFKIKNKHNITKEDLEELWGDRFFDDFELIED
ncbi:hypothetical protein KAR91_07215 [Candidatus Pacearchaeota archaeon]|nr:hypothetical protein [Candidatus Pacearchaeota archaeon]